MKRHTVRSALRTVADNHGLLRALTRREVEVRYRGTMLGLLWAVAYPLTMLAIYTFLFGVIFKARWPDRPNLPDFVLMVYCGLVTYTIFSETLTRAPTAVFSQPNYVKKVVFPLELLPLSQLGVALVNAAISFAILLLFVLVQHQAIAPSAIALPLVIAPMILALAGLAWLVSAIGVFFRDIGQVINIAMTMLISLSPVFYPVSAAPEFVQSIIYLNPLTYPIEEIRRVLIVGVWPDWWTWSAYTAASILVALAGLWVFQNTRPAFADVV